ncbi:hypothetical protein CFOL_v3_11979 [Cephalotus follicularis]|uniref:Uncharacterized protein n=1 Tax=Cephalotus follicularis TaxID=3775 RepID=A0A1Q3BKB3_CEPFO|nr:hypothetical protein CFOL_v3_11979 [Cephalotus follicularis]
MIHPLGSINLPVVTGTAPRQTQVEMTFLVVDAPSPYNAIVGRLGLNLMEAILSTRHLLMKFPTRFGVREVRGDQQAARQCYKTAISDKGKDKALPIANVELRGDMEPERPQPVEDVLQVPMEEGDNEKVFQVGSQLREAEKGELITFLRNYKDVFAVGIGGPWDHPRCNGSQAKRGPSQTLDQTKEEKIFPGETASNSRGGEQAVAGRVHKGSALLRLASESSAS